MEAIATAWWVLYILYKTPVMLVNTMIAEYNGSHGNIFLKISTKLCFSDVDIAADHAMNLCQ